MQSLHAVFYVPSTWKMPVQPNEITSRPKPAHQLHSPQHRNYLVVSTLLKNSQIGSFPQGENRNISNRHLDKQEHKLLKSTVPYLESR